MKTAPKTDVLLILVVAVVWLYLLVQSLTRETRMEWHPGQMVEVYTREGKGERPATQEEEEYDKERGQK